MPLEPKQRLGPYEIIEPLGAGGMGEVYRARDTRLDRQVAVKVLPAALSDNEQVRARFEREAKTISQLNHSNICTLHDIGNEDGVEFLVMEYIEGDRMEIYVYQLSGSGGRWQVSTDGGVVPSWSHDGRSIYYIVDQFTLMTVPIQTGATVQVGAPVKVMEVPAFQSQSRKYDVSADGSKVLWNAMVGGTSQSAPLSVVQNWPALLEPE